MEPEKPPTSWLGRTLQRIMPRRAAGDVVAANVEQGARNVVVGKNIVQISTLVVPMVPLVALLVLAVGGIVGLVWSQNSGPVTMESGFYNIVVADFAETNAQGAVVASPRGRHFSGLIGESLLKQRPDSSATHVWYSDLAHKEMATSLDLINAVTAEERRKQAQVLATRINANMVIYGVINRDNTVLPEFYISDRTSDENDWLSGSGVYQLGNRPIYLAGSSDAVGNALRERADLLTTLITALRHSSRGESADAYVMLVQATATAEPGPGRDLLLFFQGSAALFSAQKVWTTNPAEFTTLTQAAEDAFKQSLYANPTYLRAYIGLGSVAKTRADYLLLPTRPISETRDEAEQQIGIAIGFYQQAQALAPKAFDKAWSELVPAASLGSAYRSLGYLYERLGYAARARSDSTATADFAQHAEKNIDLALSLLTPVIKPLQSQSEYRLLGQSLLILGNAMSEKASLRGVTGDIPGRTLWSQRAQAIYQQCIDLETLPAASVDKILTDLAIEGKGGCRAAKVQIDKSLAP